MQRYFGVRTGRNKLIHYYQIDDWELFDLEKDLNEMQSIYNDHEHTDIVKDLKQELERLRDY